MEASEIIPHTEADFIDMRQHQRKESASAEGRRPGRFGQ